ncbi:hypothetical protein L3Q82_002525 [Scortum barcoo]|uniref:Uncharacterized protein n=1 Tax=Scortum barcoo TaxID=214431 RepID=A0ACB8VYT8_9TELE|nr:hypothetical protein L3Q82_002525 [Scortum barcoo]
MRELVVDFVTWKIFEVFDFDWTSEDMTDHYHAVQKRDTKWKAHGFDCVTNRRPMGRSETPQPDHHKNLLRIPIPKWGNYEPPPLYGQRQAVCQECTIERILTGCITAWYSSCTALNRKALQRVVKAAQQHITRTELPSMEDVYTHPAV